MKLTISQAWLAAARKLKNRTPNDVSGICNILSRLRWDGTITETRYHRMRNQLSAAKDLVRKHGGNPWHGFHWRSGLRAPRIRFCKAMARKLRGAR